MTDVPAAPLPLAPLPEAPLPAASRSEAPRPETSAAADFVLDVLAASASAPFGSLAWPEINRLAARWLRPTADGADTTRVGHALILEMAAEGLVEAETTTAADGSEMVARVVHPRIFGVQAAQRLAA